MIPEQLSHTRNASDMQADTALAEMGLRADDLTSAVAAGVRAAGRITADHPVTAPGFTLWSETVAHLRHTLGERGWKRVNPGNSPRIVSPDGRITLMPVRGNHATGVSPDVEPSTFSHRGPATVDAVRRNAQTGLALLSPEAEPADLTADHIWFLLYHWFEDSPEFRAELSLPLLSGSGDDEPDAVVFSRWRRRILLPPVDTSGFEVPMRPHHHTDDEVPFDIDEIA
ncbi:hypothetical protein [Brevibacterium album]|uniref:hypothetical protein n=1 Tax=Brevibacterium album TaxID=417948 RepID=UPI00048AB1BA|nr:hypothetical protein [Brevibacterium album]